VSVSTWEAKRGGVSRAFVVSHMWSLGLIDGFRTTVDRRRKQSLPDLEVNEGMEVWEMLATANVSRRT
jgi:hypothetical protein